MASLQKKKIKGNYYWYIVESKRIDGKPTPVVVAYLGTIENMLNKLAETSNKSFRSKSYSHGAVYSLWSIANKYGIDKIIDSVLPVKKKRGLTNGQILVMASIFKLVCKDENKDFSDWLSGTSLPSILNFKASKLTSELVWSMAEKVNEKIIDEMSLQIFQAILSNIRQNSGNTELSYGKYFNFTTAVCSGSKHDKKAVLSQDSNTLARYCLELVTGKDFAYPLFSHLTKITLNDFSGPNNIAEKVLENVYKNNGAKIHTIIFDKGTNPKDNIEEVERQKLNYICAMPASSLPEISNIPLSKFTELNILGKPTPCYRTQKVIWGKKRDCIIFFSQKQKDSLVKRLNRDINDKMEKLQYLKAQILNSDSTTTWIRNDVESRVKSITGGSVTDDLITVTITGKRIVKDINFEVNEKVYKKIVNRYFGKKLLITNNESWSTEKIVEAYMSQSEIERMFKYTMKMWNLTVDTSFQWTDSKIRLHMLLCLLGLTLAGLLREEIKKQGIDIDIDTMLDLLGQIRQATVTKPCSTKKSGIETYDILEEMSEEQYNLWSKLGNVLNIDTDIAHDNENENDSDSDNKLV